MQQIKLTEYTESYAVSIEDELPEFGMSVWFKTKEGKTFRGEFFSKMLGFYGDHFDNVKGETFDISEIESWHPVTVDL